MSNATATTFYVTVVTNALSHGGRVTVTAPDRETAAAEAIKTVVRRAKEYNAKYTAGPVKLPDWAHHADRAADYRVVGVRKAPTRRR